MQYNSTTYAFKKKKLETKQIIILHFSYWLKNVTCKVSLTSVKYLFAISATDSF